MDDQNVLIINDVGIVATLRYLGFNPLAIESSLRIVSFHFSKTPEIEKIISEYELGHTLPIDPRKLIESFKNTKGLIYRTLTKRAEGGINYER